MTMFKYDIGGYILLRGTKPIAQISCGQLAMELPSLLAHKFTGEDFTIIESHGYWTTRVDPKEEDTASNETHPRQAGVTENENHI